MNATQLHLMFTHLPIVGLGIAIMINLYSIFNKSDELKHNAQAYTLPRSDDSQHHHHSLQLHLNLMKQFLPHPNQNVLVAII